MTTYIKMLFVALMMLSFSASAAKKEEPEFKNSLRVTATAYTSHRAQTDSTPNIAAWNDRLKPGMKIIAVSRDLLKKYGMKRNTVVKIEGLPGTYRVLDKMNKRFKKKIDIYMGKDRRKALQWGRKKLTIHW
jgi:3D (Asp-Asp-Asp) domain-containing protein